MLIYILPSILILFFFYIPLPFLCGRIMRMCQRKKAISKKTVYLTFDDGPGNRLTLQILDLLKEKNIKATFFILSRNIAGREAILQSVVEHGHLIASHSCSHFNAWKVMPWKAVGDIRKGWKLLNEALPRHTEKYMYRPPCGRLNLVSLLFLWFHRIPIVFWTADCLDTWSDHQRDIQHAANKIRSDGGGIVLFHDFDRATDHLDDYVIESLKTVIDAGLRSGLRFSTIEDLDKESA
jgi:peptidoglycan/xylan/chitin deacetylase (PgdA/CDA1 family)